VRNGVPTDMRLRYLIEVYRRRSMTKDQYVERSALRSNKSMELTIKSVTPFAFAKAAPLSLAAHARC
jgi:hypothetical protein